MSESLHVDKWLYSIFSTDAQIIAAGNKAVVAGRTPTGVGFPYISFNLQSGRDITGTGAKRLMSRPLYQIEAISRGGVTSDFAAIVARIDELLENKTAEIFDGYVFGARRTQEINRIEQGANPDEYFKHVGGLYRINVFKV